MQTYHNKTVQQTAELLGTDGRPVRRAAEGQRPQYPHDPGGH